MKKVFRLIYNLAPLQFNKILRRIRDFYQWDIYYQKSWSQEGEDLILSRYFENLKTNGFYVDVGAHHPLRFSNTYKFYKQGWHGINIDAMPGSMDLFNRLRPRDINLEKAVSDSKQIMTYYAFNEPALNGFSKELTQHRDGQGNNKIIFKKDIETSTLEEILDQYMPKGQNIDFLSVDVEGLDFAVLKSNNWVKYSPELILIEICGSMLDELLNNEVTIFLRQFGYTICAKCMNTVIFKK
ncbi:MAG: SAM-dependent methyltransferase [Deltaproteobacteria bacterium HGW-Deltaproteobacteria-1]|jgi:FkbM family methyltransferase|nr:MAG: SAM-dependent methyltransferase [Deltaproteobacteria bacterium HGW-Deltaproteobacteria-1]